MKIVFDKSEHEKRFRDIIDNDVAEYSCPSSLGMTDFFKLSNGNFSTLCQCTNNCKVCWENAIDEVVEVRCDENHI